MRALVLCLALILPAAAFAEREVHVVSVAVGWSEPDVLLSVPRVVVHLDRPEAEVTLIALSRQPVIWEITSTAETVLDEVVIGDTVAQQTEVTYLGVPLPEPNTTEIGAVIDSVGSPYRELVARLSRDFDVDQLASFQGRYAATPFGFQVNNLAEDAHLRTDHLAEVASRDLSFDVDWDSQVPQPHVTPSGVTWQGQTFFPQGVPDLRFPMDAVYDPDRDQIYIMSLGGIGYVYSVDPKSGVWSVLSDQARYDGARMLLDSDRSRLIMTGAFGRPGEVRILGLNGGAEEFKLPVFAFPGLTDLYDFGRDDPVPLEPVAVQGDWLLVQAVRSERGDYRRYAVHLLRQEVVLLEYWDRDP